MRQQEAVALSSKHLFLSSPPLRCRAVVAGGDLSVMPGPPPLVEQLWSRGVVEGCRSSCKLITAAVLEEADGGRRRTGPAHLEQGLKLFVAMETIKDSSLLIGTIPGACTRLCLISTERGPVTAHPTHRRGKFEEKKHTLYI